mgnify:CR=1 FL=1
MTLRGINFHFEESPVAIEKDSTGQLSLKTNKGSTHSFSHIMFATGRRANTKVYKLFTYSVICLPYASILFW